MKFLFSLILILTTINISLSVRHHNSNEEFTKITKKILPNSELCNEQNCPANRGTCSGENFCFCFDGYFSTYESNVLCDYEQKDRTISMMKNIFMRIIIGKSLKEIVPSSNCHIQDTKEVGYPPSR